MIGARKFRTEAARKRERVRVALRLTAMTMGLVALLSGLVYALYRPELRVQEVHVTAEGSVDDEVVATVVQGLLSGSIARVVPKDSMLFLSTERIERSLRETFPRIASVVVQRADMHDLSVHITEREPAALWCGDVVPPIAYTYGAEAADAQEEVWGECYLVDAAGYLYAAAPIYTGNVFPRYYGSLERADPVGQNVFSGDEFQRFQTLFADLNGETRMLEAVLVVDERDVELYFNKGLRVFALREEVPDTIVRRVLALFESGNLTSERPIEYVDMRFGNKVYIKHSTPPNSEE